MLSLCLSVHQFSHEPWDIQNQNFSVALSILMLEAIQIWFVSDKALGMKFKKQRAPLGQWNQAYIIQHIFQIVLKACSHTHTNFSHQTHHIQHPLLSLASYSRQASYWGAYITYADPSKFPALVSNISLMSLRYGRDVNEASTLQGRGCKMKTPL